MEAGTEGAGGVLTEETTMGDTWSCQACGRQRSSSDGLLSSVVPAVKIGNCVNCRKQTTWRPTPAINAGVKVGERRKEAGMGAAERAAVPDGWPELADAELKRLAATGEQFTSDVLVGAVGAPENHYNAIGARINAAARAGIIRKVGFTKSSRETGHARTIAVWEGVK